MFILRKSTDGRYIYYAGKELVGLSRVLSGAKRYDDVRIAALHYLDLVESDESWAVVPLQQALRDDVSSRIHKINLGVSGNELRG